MAIYPCFNSMLFVLWIHVPTFDCHWPCPKVEHTAESKPGQIPQHPQTGFRQVQELSILHMSSQRTHTNPQMLPRYNSALTISPTGQKSHWSAIWLHKEGNSCSSSPCAAGARSCPPWHLCSRPAQRGTSSCRWSCGWFQSVWTTRQSTSPLGAWSSTEQRG